MTGGAFGSSCFFVGKRSRTISENKSDEIAFMFKNVTFRFLCTKIILPRLCIMFRMTFLAILCKAQRCAELRGYAVLRSQNLERSETGGNRDGEQGSDRHPEGNAVLPV